MLLARWNLWIAIAGAVFVLVVAAFLLGHARGWGERDALAKAERATMIAEAEASAAELNSRLSQRSVQLAEQTTRAERAIDRVLNTGRAEIADAAETLNPDLLYAAWLAARNRVWYDAGLSPAAGADPGALGPAPRLPAIDGAVV